MSLEEFYPELVQIIRELEKDLGPQGDSDDIVVRLELS
jgi:hypothetical protein